MTRRLGLPVLCALTAVVLGGWPTPTRAADDEDAAPKAATLTQEWVGFELTPVAFAFPDTPPFGRQGSVSTFQPGVGTSVRFGRHRWQYAYVNPFQIGLFASTAGTQTIFFHMQAEGGLIVPGTDRRLEIGLGLGFAVLSMAYSVQCDGTCTLGGTGWMVSLAARLLIVDRPTWTMGVGVRGAYPQQDPSGGGKILLTGLEFGFGRS